MKISSKTYDVLKSIALIWLPAISALYVGLAQVWGSELFPFAEQIAGTIALVVTFMGAVLQISSKNYWAEQNPLKGSDIENLEDGGRG